jgi:twinkle protein
MTEGVATKPSQPLREGGEFLPLASRHITAETCRHFGYRCTDRGQTADYYDSNGLVCAQKTRKPGKVFDWRGDAKRAGLFGFQRASSDSSSTLYITEGEIDAMALSQALGHRWPVVSVKNGAQGAAKDIKNQLDWVDVFKEIVLVFDQDKPGEEAAASVAGLFAPAKVKVARLPRKDAGEMVAKGEVEALVEAVRNAAPYRPAGIYEIVELLPEILEPLQMGLEYPWPELNKNTHGMRTGEIVTWCAGTGIGKSQVLREISHHLHMTHGQNLGVLALEESKVHTALGQISLEMGVQLHIPESRATVSDEAITEATMRVGKGYYVYDHFGSIESDLILPTIRYMYHNLGVRWFVLDHLSIMVSGQADQGDERKRIDAIVTSLATLITELDVGLHLVTHLRRPSGTPFEEGGHITLADLRGSSQIAGVSHMVIALERDPHNETSKNVTKLRTIKNRFSGELGDSGYLEFLPETGRLVPTTAPDDKFDTTTASSTTGEL